VITWTLDGGYEAAYDSLTIIPSSQIAVNQTWCAFVRPHDGQTYGQIVAANCVTVAENGENIVPQVLTNTFYFEPWPPRSTQNLELYYDYFDQDNQPESKTEIHWYKNGDLQPQFNDLTTLPSWAISPGDHLSVTVHLHDGDVYGPSFSILAAVNSPPECSGVVVKPKDPLEGQALRVDLDKCVDRDNDPIEPAQISWYSGDQLRYYHESEPFLPHGLTSTDERWQATALPYDGFEYGRVVTSDIAIIQPRPDVTRTHHLYFPAALCSYPLPVWDSFHEDNDFE
jgi:hypothetical protein